MKKTDNSINVRIFYALKVAEKSQVPLLIMSNPGMGKTTTIVMYGKLRNMDVVCLQGNAETAEAIHGYETVSSAPVKPGEVVISSRTRPSWMNRILENQKNGRKTILFLDEITTANEYVQSALLKLIFDRTCGVEKLPPVEECLIVSAGNYINNLTSTMTVIAPLMNRFMIYNVTPTADDLGSFLNKYKGALGTGVCVDPMVEVESILRDLDNQESKVSEETKNKIGEYFEKSILETARMLITKSGKVDLSVTDLRNIYGDVDDEDPNLYGFITPRSLCYLREVTVACYLCFGKAGIQSDNFKQMINGLVGIGLSKETKGSNIHIKTNKIGSEFYTSLCQISVELDKLSSTILPEYVSYFTGMVNNVNNKGRAKDEIGKFSMPELQALRNKLEEMCSDKRLANVEKPLEDELLSKLSSTLTDTSSLIPMSSKYSVPESSASLKESLEKANVTVETVTGFVNVYNNIADTYNTLRKFVHFESWNYNKTTKEKVDKLGNTLSTPAVSVKMMKRMILSAVPGSSNLIPEAKTIDTH